MTERENETNILYKTHRRTQRETLRDKRKKIPMLVGDAPTYTGERKGWIRKKWFQAGVFTAAAAAAKSLQLCPTLCNPIDGSPPGSPIPGILQAGTLEWVAIYSGP